MGGGPQAAPASLPSRGPAVPPALLDHLGVAGWQSRTKRVCSAGAPEQAKTKQNKGLGACSVVPWRQPYARLARASSASKNPLYLGPTRRRSESSRIGDRGADFSAEVPSLVNHESALPLYTGQ